MPCSFELLQQYFLANKQYFSLTANQHKPNLSETNMAVRPKHYPREAISDRVFFSLAVNPPCSAPACLLCSGSHFHVSLKPHWSAVLNLWFFFGLTIVLPVPGLYVWFGLLFRTGPTRWAHSANEMKMDLLTAQLRNANGWLIRRGSRYQTKLKGKDPKAEPMHFYCAV